MTLGAARDSSRISAWRSCREKVRSFCPAAARHSYGAGCTSRWCRGSGEVGRRMRSATRSRARLPPPRCTSCWLNWRRRASCAGRRRSRIATRRGGGRSEWTRATRCDAWRRHRWLSDRWGSTRGRCRDPRGDECSAGGRIRGPSDRRRGRRLPAAGAGGAQCAALHDGRPWLLFRPVGRQIWAGPLFRPGVTACWECLALRLRANAPVATYLESRDGRDDGPGGNRTPEDIAANPASRLTAWGLAASAVVSWIVQGELPFLEGKIQTLDPVTWKAESHAMVRLPFCPACGPAQAPASRWPGRSRSSAVPRRRVRTAGIGPSRRGHDPPIWPPREPDHRRRDDARTGRTGLR